jgi:hypothetical protein
MVERGEERRVETIGLDIFGSGWRYLVADMHVYDRK